MDKERERERQRGSASRPPADFANPFEVPPPPTRWSAGFIGTAVAVGLLVAGLAAWQWRAVPTGDAGLSPSQREARLDVFKREGVLHLPVVDPAGRAKALDDMHLAPADRAALEKDVTSNKVVLATLTLWDDEAEDGDVVQVQGAGFTQTVRIAHAPQVVVVPLTGGSTFQVTGVHDGGGGITVALKANGRDVPLPVMDEGQSVAVAFGS